MIFRNTFKILLIFAISAFATPLSAQKPAIKILGLSVEGHKSADANIIKINAGLSPGKEVTSEDIQGAIKNLWNLNIFSDIEILIDRELADGIYLTIRVEEYPRLEKVELEGNKKIKKDDIEKELNFYRGQILSARNILKAKKSLKNLYKEKGYLLAEINHETYDSESEGKVILRFKIDEGNKVQVKKINFFGNENFDDGKLRKQMKEIKEDRWWRGADFDQEEFDEDKIKIVEFYRNEGFRDAEVVSDSIYYDEKKKDMFIDITVNEGLQYYFGDITWEGNELFEAEQLSAWLDFKKGDTYSAEKLQKAVIERLGTFYYNEGYIWVNINPREIPVARDTVDLHFNILEGNLAMVNKIHIAGNTRTKEKVIRRELRIAPNHKFSKAALERSQREVWVLNYFSDVKIDYWPAGDDKIDLKFEVEEKSTDLANMSAGWSERDKLIGSVGVSMNNLFGNGQRLSFDWNFGRYYRSFQISFTEPWLLDTPTLAGFSFYDTKRDAVYYYGYNQRSMGGSFRLGRRFRWPDNYFRGDWIYRIDRTELSDFSSDIIEFNPRNIVNEDWPLISSSVTQIISRNSLNRPEFPTEGSEFSISTEVAGSVLGGNVGYHKHIMEAGWFFPAFWKFILYSKATGGFIDGFSNDSKVPYLEYFFMGGEGMSRSIPLRGYDDPLAGVTTSPGGKVMFKYTLEMRFPIIPNPTMFGLIFGEAGNTWEDLGDTDPFDLRRSLGIGARIYMPMIGIIGFDYAYGFDKIDANGNVYGGWHPHFVFGRSF
jgi:outer membrane protein insertion porin family